MPKRAKGRTLAEFLPLQPAEQSLLDACAAGDWARVSSECPVERTDANAVRAAFLRFLCLGGDDEAPVHEHGVQLSGAWIDGEWNLEGATVPRRIALAHCCLHGAANLRHACVFGALSLAGSTVHNLTLDAAEVKGDVHLGNGIKASGTTRLLDVQIDGSLNCGGGNFDGKEENSLWADRALVKGNVFLNKGFKASGTVRMLGAQIGGNLECDGGSFDGKGRRSVNLERTEIGGALLVRDLSQQATKVVLSHAKVGVLVDDAQSWGVGLSLNGFVYDSLGGGAPTDAAARLRWLDLQVAARSGQSGEGADFRPQPWRQLQKVLRDMGHTEDARQVAIAFEKRQRHAGLIGRSPVEWHPLRRWFYRHVCRAFHTAFGALIGYGYRPLRLGLWMLAVWLLSAAFYWHAALQGAMGPSNPIVFQHTKYEKTCPSNWYLCEDLPEEYTGFSPLVYSLDVLLPLVNLGQEADWAPLIPTPKASWWAELFGHWTLKHVVRLVVWAEILFGWVASLLLVAVVSGLTKRRED